MSVKALQKARLSNVPTLPLSVCLQKGLKVDYPSEQVQLGCDCWAQSSLCKGQDALVVQVALDWCHARPADFI